MLPEPVIQAFELSKIYHHPFFAWLVRAKALQALTMRVERGTVHGLLGPNGSGKSTTIKLILGLIFPSGGHVSVFGRYPEDMAVKSRIGFLPEETYLYRFLDAQETLDFYARLFGLPSRERARRVDALLELTGLTRERHRPLAEYSKGMLRRIGIAQALVNDPELIIFDEPTTGLDPIGTREIKDLIIQLREKGKTVLLSSHLLADVEDVCDNVSILYGGVLQADGPMEALLRQQNLTQITAQMDEATIREVVELIRKRSGKGAAEIRVAPPTERLEEIFLRIVENAQFSNAATSGARAGSGDLSFLTQVPAESLLSRLQQDDLSVSPPRAGAASVAAAAAMATAHADPGLLSKLAGEDEDDEDEEDGEDDGFAYDDEEYEDDDEADGGSVLPARPAADTGLLRKLTEGNNA